MATRLHLAASIMLSLALHVVSTSSLSSCEGGHVRVFSCLGGQRRDKSCLKDLSALVGEQPTLRLRGGSDQQASNFEEIGKAFVSHYYSIFDSNRAGLQGLYQDMSMLTFEGEKIQGAAAIGQKLTSLPFQTVKHEVVTVDSQPAAGGGVLVFACGNLKVDGSENPMKFSQVFCLMPLQGVQGYFCYNDVFRLNYG
eukprot:CAMPEP_0181327276 /NCGR_PEP_ID=MMETSP1101-20121128/22007_1 /TAXON_ID=46948 /ORGANISM="Rhodomonas abbreviata, Strain Caron Lab Isolate" /LENGTH=195 /DNA_ID=CAMNT_0023435909 /DNA_START=8 /DNA_END=595 /DNA_ORIENTATION=+